MSVHWYLLHEIQAKTGGTQVQLAERFGTSQATVSRWLKGEDTPRLDQQRRIETVCRHLGILATPAYLGHYTDQG